MPIYIVLYVQLLHMIIDMTYVYGLCFAGIHLVVKISREKTFEVSVLGSKISV